ncbi:hypothetical protein Tco_0711555 [Tanacetum coccineum]
MSGCDTEWRKEEEDSREGMWGVVMLYGRSVCEHISQMRRVGTHGGGWGFIGGSTVVVCNEQMCYRRVYGWRMWGSVRVHYIFEGERVSIRGIGGKLSEEGWEMRRGFIERLGMSLNREHQYLHLISFPDAHPDSSSWPVRDRDHHLLLEVLVVGELHLLFRQQVGKKAFLFKFSMEAYAWKVSLSEQELAWMIAGILAEAVNARKKLVLLRMSTDI